MILKVLHPGKNCWNCDLIHWEAGSQGYSEATPGFPPEMDCSKGHWCMNEDDTLTEVREKLSTAERCLDFQPYQKPAESTERQEISAKKNKAPTK